MRANGNRTLRHTPSMMALPNFVDIFEEKDEDDIPLTPSIVDGSSDFDVELIINGLIEDSTDDDESDIEDEPKVSITVYKNVENVNSNESSLNMKIDCNVWMMIDDNMSDSDSKEYETIFDECGIKYDFDDSNGGGMGKIAAIDFFDLQFFFQFIYDRFHMQSQFLLNTSLPIYSEWKKMRKVHIRTSALKTVDYSLKACIESVDIMKAVVRNSLLICHSLKQKKTQILFEGCSEPMIKPTTFECGHFSLLAAWDLFDQGSTASAKDWTFALNSYSPAQYLSSCDPDLRHLNSNELHTNQVYHKYRKYQFFILAEFVNQQNFELRFGDEISWQSVKESAIKYRSSSKSSSTPLNSEVLSIWNKETYHLNPSINILTELMSDCMQNKNRLYHSNHQILADPIVWLLFIEFFILDRQAKLQNLYITAKAFLAGSNISSNKVRGQKLNSLIESLANQAKDESDRLRSVMKFLPTVEDLRETFEHQLIESQRPLTTYVKSYNSTILNLNKKSISSLV